MAVKLSTLHAPEIIRTNKKSFDHMGIEHATFLIVVQYLNQQR
jgi:hypothetical protein